MKHSAQQIRIKRAESITPTVKIEDMTNVYQEVVKTEGQRTNQYLSGISPLTLSIPVSQVVRGSNQYGRYVWDCSGSRALPPHPEILLCELRGIPQMETEIVAI